MNESKERQNYASSALSSNILSNIEPKRYYPIETRIASILFLTK